MPRRHFPCKGESLTTLDWFIRIPIFYLYFAMPAGTVVYGCGKPYRLSCPFRAAE
jgi:hypothetical protein